MPERTGSRTGQQKTYLVGQTEIAARPLAPALYLVATPIGNLGDITLRALETLAAADMLACEDTRVTRVLLDRYGIRQRPFAYHEHNAAEAGPRLIAALEAGKSVALVSDAGTPLVSDPGLSAGRQALERGIRVVPIPGAVGGAGGADGVRPALRRLPVRRLSAGEGRPAADAAGGTEGRAGDADLLRIAAPAGRHAWRHGRRARRRGRRRSAAN